MEGKEQKRINLTEEELALLEHYVEHGENFVAVTDVRKQQIYTSILDKAEELEAELEAYEESCPDLLVWFYGKYKDQGQPQ